MLTKHKPKDSAENFRKSHEISSSNIKLFSSYAQKLLGGHKVSPPGQIGLTQEGINGRGSI